VLTGKPEVIRRTPILRYLRVVAVAMGLTCSQLLNPIWQLWFSETSSTTARPQDCRVFRSNTSRLRGPDEIRPRPTSARKVVVSLSLTRGDIDTPKGRKGKRTARTVALPPGTVAELQIWRMMLPKQTPQAYLFPSERDTPLRRDNVWYRAMLPKLKAVGLEWATFQVLRGTNASLSRIAKIDDKVAADQRGHGLGVSLEVYSISDLQQKIEVVKRLESEVIQ
jgi:hypothetical protein